MDNNSPRLSMQRGFTKLFNTIVTSTIWREDDQTRIVWITMLAIADAEGVVSASIPGLAAVANVSMEATEKAIKNLSAPDEYSRTQDFEGRRIENVDGGWRVLNYVKYRRMLSEEERREYKAKWAREKRGQRRQKVDNVDASRRMSTSLSASSSASLLKEGVRGRFEEWVKVRKAQGRKPKDWDAMFDEQIKWLSGFSEADQLEILSNSIRNNYQGLFPPRNSGNHSSSITTKYGLPLPKGCTIRKDGEVLDYTGRVMDINQVRRANQA